MDGRSGTELHVGAEVVDPCLAVGAQAAGYAGLDSHTVTHLQERNQY